ncbi:Aste57867_21612 [Aphanomyces stellatus]|uniref:Aste57867_21612 protein n=1 Tax=Aphanomyces stellatus TaxID=120398 RepID=A0A485LK21_9STRA|nr:hypothetical protein As57867_021543 [Aphanomyces stellatus]VFT98282.1 Aste57867_21612 [Aphanomyces stellatus]
MWRRSISLRAVAQRSLLQAAGSSSANATMKSSMKVPAAFPTRFLSTQSTTTLQEAAASGNWKAALSVLAELDAAGKTNADSYELAVEALGRNQKVDAMESILDAMKADGVVATSATIDMMVQTYMANNEPLKIIELATERLRANEPLSLAAFQSTMAECSTLAKVEYPEEILTILRNTPSCATPLSANEFAALVRCFGICRRSDLSMHAFYVMQEQGIEGSVDVFTQLIRAHISVGAVNQALHVFSLCDQRGIVLGESIHAATIGKLCERKGFWLATELFDTMERKNLQTSHYCMAKMILAYIRTNNLPAAYDMWERIVAHERPATISTYMSIMHDCVVTGEMDLLLAVFEEMQRHHASLPNVAYSFAIRGLGRKGDTEGALELMENYIDKFGPPRDATTYIAVFNALARSLPGQTTDGTRSVIVHYWDMMMTNVTDTLQAPAFASAAGAFASSGDLDSLTKLFAHTKKHLPTSDAMMYAGAISGFAKASTDYSDHIHDFLTKMYNLNIPIHDAAVRAASDAFVKYEHWDYMKELLKVMDPAVFTRPEGVVGDVLSKLLEVGHWPLARATINAALVWDIQPHIRSKPQVLQRLADETDQKPEWKIAFGLATETVSFATINEEHVYAVCNAMKVLFRAEKYNLVARLWYALKSKNHLPLPIDAYKCIVLSSLHSEFPRAAITAAEEMLDMLTKYHADIVDTSDVADVFSVIITSFATHGEDEMVTRLFEHMEGFNLVPNGYAYLAALRTYASAEDTPKVKALLDGFEEYMSLTHMDPDDMSKTLSSLVSQYAQDRNDEMVLSVFELMQKFDLAPNSYAFNAAIRAYSRTHQLDRVKQLQDALVASTEHVHTRVVESILSSYILANDVAGIQRTMAEFECDADAVLSSFLNLKSVSAIAMLCKAQGNRNAKLASQLSNPMQTKALKWLLNRNAVAQAADVALFLLQNNYSIAPFVFERVLDALSLEGAYEVGSALLDANNKRRPYINNTSGVVNSMLTIMGNARDYVAIREMLTETTQLYEVEHYALGMYCCIDGSAYVDALKIFEKMRQRFIEPNGHTFCLALDACEALQDTRVAKLIVQDVCKHRFEGKIKKELHARLAFATRADALAIDDTLVERVALFALFLEESGYDVHHSFLNSLLGKSNSDHLTLGTRTRVYATLNSKRRARPGNVAPSRPWWLATDKATSVDDVAP